MLVFFQGDTDESHLCCTPLQGRVVQRALNDMPPVHTQQGVWLAEG